MEIKITLPRPHPGQREVLAQQKRFNVLCCGRRFGKTKLGIDRLIRPALEGKPVAWFSPTYKMLTEVWREVKEFTEPITRLVSAQEHRVELITGGTVDMWSLDTPNAARGRKYGLVVVDEAAMIRHLEEAWQSVLRPTLADFRGEAWFLSTPRGRDFFWRLYCLGEDPGELEWASWQLPTSRNPFIHLDEIEAARRGLPERIFSQEFLAQFLEDSGGVFRGVREVIDAGREASESPAPGRSYYLGVDLARVEDFTVLCVVSDAGRQVYFERFNQISWERQVATIERVARLYNAKIYLDSTGVGDPIYERVRKLGLSVAPYSFTNQSKEALIDNLAMKIESGACRLMDLPVQTNELLAYQYELTPSRNVRMNAPPGSHDDCVIGLALACWGLQAKTRIDFS